MTTEVSMMTNVFVHMGGHDGDAGSQPMMVEIYWRRFPGSSSGGAITLDWEP